MSKKCDCCGKGLGLLGGYELKEGVICGKCRKIYEATGRKFKKKLTIDEIQEVIHEEGASVDVKPVFFEFIDIFFGGIVNSRKKSMIWGIIFISIGFLAIPWMSRDLVKYLRDGAKVQFTLVDEKEKWIDSTTDEITKYYEGEYEGQIIHYSHSYRQKHELGSDRVTGREDNTVDSMSLDGTIRVYRENGEWKLAKNAQPKDYFLLMVFPTLLIICGVYFITRFFKLKKLQKNQQTKDSDKDI